MRSVKLWYYERLASRTVKALKSNGISAYYVETKDEAREIAFDMVAEEATIGFGGSITLDEIGLLEALEKKNCKLITYAEDVSIDKKTEQRRRALTSDYYFTGTNAITVDGKLINIDATGNRVSAMIFGPKHVIVIAGANKIVKNTEEALLRAKEEAAVMNAKRLNRQVPCTVSGKCEDCNSKDRICNITTIIEKKPSRTGMTVIIIGDDFGL